MEAIRTDKEEFRPKPTWLRGLIADVHPTVLIGENTSVWSFAVILINTIIGNNCAIGSGCYIGRRCRIGDNVRIQDKAHITDDVIMEDNVFIGPCAVTMDARYPRSGEPYKHEPPYFEEGCTIGAGAVILPGVRVGRNSMIGAGAVVTKDIPPNVIMTGVPATLKRLVRE